MIILITIHAIITICLIVVILMQKRSTGALGGLAGQSNPSRGTTSRTSSNPLAKLTTWLATIFIALSLALAYLSKSSSVDSTAELQKALLQKNNAPAIEGGAAVNSIPSRAKEMPAVKLTPPVEGNNSDPQVPVKNDVTSDKKPVDKETAPDKKIEKTTK